MATSWSWLNNVNLNDEIKSERKERQKVFQIDSTHKRYIISSGPIHWWSEIGEGTNPSVDEWDDLDAEFESKDGGYETKNARFKVRISNNINNIIKFIRKNFDVVMYPISLTLDGVSVNYNPPLNLQLVNKYTVEIEIQSDVWLRIRYNGWRLTSYIKTTRTINTFNLTEIVKLNNSSILNSYTQQGGEKAYIPNENGEFVIQTADGDVVKIAKPLMWNEDGESSNEIIHELIEISDKIYYKKYPTSAGEDWLLLSGVPVYIDGTTYTSTTKDGVVIKSGVDTWSNIRDAEIGDSAIDNENTSLNIAGSWLAKTTYGVRRSFFYFDTSDIGSDNVDTAIIYIYGNTNGHTGVCCLKGTQSDTLTTSDFVSFTGNIYGRFNEESGDGDGNWNSGDWNICNIDGSTDLPDGESGSDGREDINKTGTTKICLREYTGDYKNSAPTGYQYNGGVFADNADNKPYLDLTISEGGSEETPLYLANSGRLSFSGGSKELIFVTN